MPYLNLYINSYVDAKSLVLNKFFNIQGLFISRGIHDKWWQRWDCLFQDRVYAPTAHLRRSHGYQVRPEDSGPCETEVRRKKKKDGYRRQP